MRLGEWIDGQPSGEVMLQLRVTPKASSNRILVEDDIIKIYVTTVPEKGKANKAVIALLAKELGCAKSALEIVRGDTDRNKQVRYSR